MQHRRIGAGPAGPVLAGPLFLAIYLVVKIARALYARAYYSQTTSKVLPTPLNAAFPGQLALLLLVNEVILMWPSIWLLNSRWNRSVKMSSYMETLCCIYSLCRWLSGSC